MLGRTNTNLYSGVPLNGTLNEYPIMDGEEIVAGDAVEFYSDVQGVVVGYGDYNYYNYFARDIFALSDGNYVIFRGRQIIFYGYNSDGGLVEMRLPETFSCKCARKVGENTFLCLSFAVASASSNSGSVFYNKDGYTFSGIILVVDVNNDYSCSYVNLGMVDIPLRSRGSNYSTTYQTDYCFNTDGNKDILFITEHLTYTVSSRTTKNNYVDTFEILCEKNENGVWSFGVNFIETLLSGARYYEYPYINVYYNENKYFYVDGQSIDTAYHPFFEGSVLGFVSDDFTKKGTTNVETLRIAYCSGNYLVATSFTYSGNKYTGKLVKYFISDFDNFSLQKINELELFEPMSFAWFSYWLQGFVVSENEEKARFFVYSSAKGVVVEFDKQTHELEIVISQTLDWISPVVGTQNKGYTNYRNMLPLKIDGRFVWLCVDAAGDYSWTREAKLLIVSFNDDYISDITNVIYIRQAKQLDFIKGIAGESGASGDIIKVWLPQISS